MNGPRFRVPGFVSLLMAFCVFLAFANIARAGQAVELELVLAIDTSTSVNSSEYELQRRGIAEALRDPKVLAVIEQLGPAGLALSVVQWAGAGRQIAAVPWRHINSVESALGVAGEVATMPRHLTGFTDIAGAIRFSANSLMTNAFEGRRLVIDVSGDGTSDGVDPAVARDAAIRLGITINGLIIYSIEYDLADLARIDLRNHYRDRVIGGPGAFYYSAENFRSFGESMRDKLLREIAGPQVALRRLKGGPSSPWVSLRR